MERHAVYATAKLQVRDPSARGGVRVDAVCFRVGQPTTLENAHERWDRLFPAPRRAARVRHARRWYRIEFYEVRECDRHGRGLGSERHATAIPVPYVAAQRKGL
jgi:hypothetical protein